MEHISNKDETKVEPTVTEVVAKPAKPEKPVVAASPPDGGITLSQAIAEATGDPNAGANVGVYTEMAAAGASSASVSSTFNDDFNGKGGTYAFNKDGQRVPVYEQYIDAETGEKDFRPIR